jgi:cell division inhibitor SulA
LNLRPQAAQLQQTRRRQDATLKIHSNLRAGD